MAPLDDEPLAQRVAEPHVDPAVDLSLGGARVQRAPDVVGGDEPPDLHLAGLRVHVDDGRLEG